MGVMATGVWFLAQGTIYARTLTFGWSPNTDAVAGYRIHYGPASRSYNQAHDAGNATTGTVANLVPGATYYFALTAYNVAGLESDFSSEVTYFVPTNVAPPTAFALRVAVTPSRQAVLTLTGPTNRAFGIEATTNLAPTNLTVWTGIGAVTTGPAGSAVFTDTNAPTHRRRFYRARAL